MARILATQGVALGHEIEVLTDSPAVSLEDDRRQPFKITRTRSFTGRVRAFSRADAVLFMNVSLPGVLAAVCARPVVVFSHHGTYGARGVLRGRLETLKRHLTRYYPNICVSRFVAGHIPGESVVVHNAYDNAVFQRRDVPKRERHFVVCGRLVSDKGVDVCLRALAQAQAGELVPSLTIIGDGPERGRLEALTRRLALEGRVRFVGRMFGEGLAAELHRHACMVVPSLWEEPFGIVALEGIACCDTVIVTRRGGLPEAIGGCGVVVDPSETELATAMTAVARSRRCGGTLPGQPTDAQRQTHLAAHSPAAVAQQYFSVIENAIASRRASRHK